MSAAMPADSTRSDDALAEPEIRRLLETFVRRRVPASDVDDVVQTVLCEALASPSRPTDPAELRRWLLGMARHKAADVHRRAAREMADELPDIPAGPAPHEARHMVDWAERQAASVRGAETTLRWMAREGEGEKLEAIAADERLPAATVRQRVSRMRRWMRERWAAELALVAALAVVIVALVRWLRPKDGVPEAVVPEPIPSAPAPLEERPLDRARSLRAEALEACDREAFRECLDGLDRAKALDPTGDADPAVRAARERAAAALEPPPSPPEAEKEDGEKKLAPAPRKEAPPKPMAPKNVAPVTKEPPHEKLDPKLELQQRKK